MAPAALDTVHETHKRQHSPDHTDAALNDFATPVLRPVFGQPMASFFEQLKPVINQDLYERVDTMAEDGLYLHKRHIRGDHGKVLEQAGTVLQHVVVYLKSGEQVVALDFGPVGEADVTANLMEYAPCGPVRHELAEVPHAPDALPFLRIKAAHHGATSNVLAQAVEFAQGRQYHAMLNNCIQNCDFLVRALTGGSVRSAPLVYDALCGRVPPQDNPMLLMFMLMTRLSWFDVCDGSRVAAAFLEQHSCPPPLSAGDSSGATTCPAETDPTVTHADKAAKHSAEQGPETEQLEAQQRVASREEAHGSCSAAVAPISVEAAVSAEP